MIKLNNARFLATVERSFDGCLFNLIKWSLPTGYSHRLLTTKPFIHTLKLIEEGAIVKEPNIKIRRSKDRGLENFGWTDNWMTFSFANYHDPEWMHFGPIRVIVENHIQPHQGFRAHPHRDME
ncbi:MAG TPA: hypothetical protein VE870_12795, partial [Bacteroidales bacterium]|nr:hypothetical protein [Bacteroidales bacterium]